MSKILNEIKSANEKYEGVKIENAVYYKKSKSLEVTLLLCVHFDDSDKAVISKIIQEKLPFVSLDLQLKKVVCDCDLLAKKIMEFVAVKHKVLKDRIKACDISTSKEEDGVIKIMFSFEKFLLII